MKKFNKESFTHLTHLDTQEDTIVMDRQTFLEIEMNKSNDPNDIRMKSTARMHKGKEYLQHLCLPFFQTGDGT